MKTGGAHALAADQQVFLVDPNTGMPVPTKMDTTKFKVDLPLDTIHALENSLTESPKKKN